jgi:GT2 family glycosyltransferase
MQYNISLLVGLKNNLDYTSHFYKTTRALYPEVEICFVSYGSTDGTHEWLDSLNDPHLKYFHSTESRTFSDTFNKAAEISTKDYVAYLHNDIVLAPYFIENLTKHISVNKVVSYTTIEPPIFSSHERPGKIIMDFGVDLRTFDLQNFYKFTKESQKSYEDKLEQGITFFMCLSRDVLLGVGGMDSLFNPMFCEDDDLITRLKLLGLECTTSLDAICYHFVSKTSRFSEEYINTTRLIETRSNRNYIRKWGSRSSTAKYNTAFVVNNCNLQILDALEPWCDKIYIEDDAQVITLAYLEKEQKDTVFDLSKRVLPITINDPFLDNDIVVEFDAKLLNNQNFQLIQQLSDIIKDSGEIGKFQLDVFAVTIKNMTTYENKLINLTDEYYTSKLIKL